MKKQASTIVLIFIFLLGLCILLYPMVANWWNSRIHITAISEYESVLHNVDKEDYSQYFQQADAFNEEIRNSGRILMLDEDLQNQYEKMLKIPDTSVMAYIQIEKLKVVLPIYHGTSNAVLTRGVGHLEGTSLPVGGPGTHCALSAHRGLPSSKLFSDLDDMEVGDHFIITVLDRLMTYEVDQIKIVLPEELSCLRIEPDQDLCTLVTCTPYGINTHRLLVRGHRVDNESAAPQIYVPNEAIKVDPLVVAPIVAIPLVILTMIGVAVKYRKKK